MTIQDIIVKYLTDHGYDGLYNLGGSGCGCELYIIVKYLTDHGYDGLYNLDGDGCGCELSDLMSCCDDPMLCKPGYKVKCTRIGCGEDCGFHIVAQIVAGVHYPI